MINFTTKSAPVFALWGLQLLIKFFKQTRWLQFSTCSASTPSRIPTQTLKAGKIPHCSFTMQYFGGWGTSTACITQEPIGVAEEAQLLFILWVEGHQSRTTRQHRDISAGCNGSNDSHKGAGRHHCQWSPHAKSWWLQSVAARVTDCQGHEGRCQLLHWPQLPACCTTAGTQPFETSPLWKDCQIFSLAQTKLHRMQFRQFTLA